MVDSPQEYSEEHILSAISASTKPSESQIAKIGMMHNSKGGHFGLERTLKRLKDQNDVWQFQRQHIRQFIDECARCQKNEYAENTNSRSWIHNIHLHSHGMSKHRLY